MAVLCLLPNTPWPWPTPSRAASARCGKSGRQASRRPEEANTWSCTELFPSPFARQERRSSAGLVSLLGAEREKLLLFCCCFSANQGRRCGQDTGPQRRVAEDAHAAADRGETSALKASRPQRLSQLCVYSTDTIKLKTCLHRKKRKWLRSPGKAIRGKF